MVHNTEAIHYRFGRYVTQCPKGAKTCDVDRGFLRLAVGFAATTLLSSLVVKGEDEDPI